MDDKLLYWVWLTLCFPAGSKKMQQLLDEGFPREIYESRDALAFDFLMSSDLHRLQTISLGSAEKVLDDCRKLGVHALTMEDDAYPQRLRDIDTPPPVLYYQGDLQELDRRLTIGIVGTRDITDYYKKCTGNISYQLARAGAVIISGCAVGCDEYGHRGAIRARGRTIGVLACGFGVNYPRQTEEVRQQMLELGGALVSELPPYSREERHYFRVRNRLIAALSEGVLVTQVPVRSGAILTADHAINQGKELFCLPPADIFSTECMGAAALIRDGAQVVFSARDILEVYLDRFGPEMDTEKVPTEDMIPAVGMRSASIPAKTEKPAEPKPVPHTEIVPEKKESTPLPDDLTDVQRRILTVLEKGPAHAEDLLHEVEVASYEMLALMTELELYGLVRSLSGQRYERI